MSLTDEYWPCPLCIITLMIAHAKGRIEHEAAYRALEHSGLVEDWPPHAGRVRTTAKGSKFVEMILEVPLPIQDWVDPRNKEEIR